MKNLLKYVAVACTAFAMNAQTAEFFQPYKSTQLRMPSVPLVVSDPYFSIWSPYDQLTDGSTRHWTNDEKPMEGLLRVDGKTYRFMGVKSTILETIVPMADEEAWTAAISREANPGNGWEKPGFDDSKWRQAKAAFGSPDLSFVRTHWSQENSDLYVRRTVNLTDADLQGNLFMVYSHDDVFHLYVNGTEVAQTGETWREGVKLELTDEVKKLFHAGENVIAAHCHNTTGGAYTDFGLYRNKSVEASGCINATQKSVDVLATSTYYTFTCGPVDLDVVFTAPMLIDNYDLLSSPINYISYQVRANDGKEHDVQMMLTASPLIAQNKTSQPTRSSIVEMNGVKYAKTGTVEQPILAKKGDHICIDWGYLYLPAINGDVCLAQDQDIKNSFINKGVLPASAKEIVAQKASERPLLAYIHNFGKTAKAASYTMIGYDEVFDIEYFYKRYKAYWAHNGSVTIADMFDYLKGSYASIMNRCRDLDKTIYDDGATVGGVKYAELLSGSYRHVIAAHKLFKDDEGNLLFFSKENDSNGCVNTVDLTYPESPLFFCYNPELQKAMMTSILEYSRSGRWTKPFAAHDLGTYPIANGQVYGGDMPLEEAGNILTLVAMCCDLDGNTAYAEPYWDVLKTWADYLSENGQDPENQLCTDDFAGHWAHNANLSIKAIMGVTAFGKLAALKGDNATADKYIARAKEMASKWATDAFEGSKSDAHYRLAFDRENTWSQKYNMVWDKLWNTQIFPQGTMQTEINYYLKKQNQYGLPLDCRKDYTKSDWVMWTAAMSPDQKTLKKFIDPLYDYVNETETRVPISDWYDTVTGRKTGFMARSVIAGHWMPVLAYKLGR
jgi:hypothetical protein